MTKENIARREFLGRSAMAAAGLSLPAIGVQAAKKPAKIRVGINLLLWTDSPTEEHFGLLDTLKKWGYDGAEFPMFQPAGDHWAKLGKHCQEIGLGNTSCVCVPKEADPTHEDAKIRQAAVDFLKRCVDCTHALGGSQICGPLYAPVGKLVGRGRTEEEFKRIVEVMRQACEYAATAQIELAIEPLNRFETYVINSQEDGLKLVDAVSLPNFGLHYDTFHSHIEEKDSPGIIRQAGKRIHHVHISENDRSTPGQGQVHWKEIFRALKDAGYDHWLTIEAFGRSMPAVAAATCIWRKMFESEEQLARDGLKFVRKSWND
ncbi:MAG: sugar phosphate isomerase/epimerase family protein [Candidatus Omnitrophota bacterium]